jgi:hypothetical protein
MEEVKKYIKTKLNKEAEIIILSKEKIDKNDIPQITA